MSRVRLLHITTVPMTLEYLIRGQIPYMQARGFEIIAISSPGPGLDRVAGRDGIMTIGVEMSRSVAPAGDLLALNSLYYIIKELKPSIVHSSTGKAGFLGVMAARAARVPAVVYTLRGLMLHRGSFITKPPIYLAEKITCSAAHKVIAVSRSVKDFVVSKHLCSAGKIVVRENGSSNGVDAKRFDPQLYTKDRLKIREAVQIPEHATVIGFVGRVTAGKGIRELFLAWLELAPLHPDAYLLVIGDVEPHDPVEPEILQGLRNAPRVIWLKHVLNDYMPSYYASMDILALPTYSEGFPNVVMEASAMSLPVAASAVVGCVDAVVNEKTGILVPPRDSKALSKALSRYVLSPDLRFRHGKAGRERVQSCFKPEDVWEFYYREYMSLIKQAQE